MKKISCIGFLACTLVIYMVMFWTSMSSQGLITLPETVDQQIVTIEEGELINGQQHGSISLPAYFDVTDETYLKFTMDYAFSGRTVPSLILQANHTFMTILLDGEEIYHVEPKPYSFGNYFTHIPLPQKVSDAQLEIRVAVPENGLTRVSMPDLVIANEAVFLRQQILQDIPALLLNTLILFSGIILLALALIGRKSVDPYRMLMRGLMALNCALYFMCETYSVVFLASDARVIYIMDMLSFAMLGPALLGLIAWNLEDWRGKLINIIAGIGIVTVIAQAGLSLFGGIELRQLLPMTHMVQVTGILVVIACVVYGLIYKKSNGDLYIGGLVALSGAADLILFMCKIGENNVFFLKISLLIYFMHQMYQFINSLMQHSAEKARESYYKTLAMQDPLSHCYSRAAFEIDKEVWSEETVRTVFFLDLNNLKTTNDLYGHGAGDQLIHAFGGVLNRVFFSAGKCYRVGGDEFWVFCDGLAPGQAVEMMRTAQLTTDTYNCDSDLPAKLSYAIGVCDTNETQGDLKRAIELADERMYENKREVKQKMKL